MSIGRDLEHAIAALPVPAYVTEAPGGSIRLWNQHAVDVWGRVPADGDHEARFFTHSPALEALLSRRPRVESVVIQRPDGSRRVGRVQVSLLPDAPGRPALAIAIFQDTTAPEFGSQALWLSETRYRSIVEDQPDLVCRFLADGTLTFVNEAYCRYFNVRREEILGSRYAPIVHREDLPRVLALVETLSPANPVVYIENRVIRGDGAVRWTEWTNRAIYDDRHQFLEFQSAGRDITERRRAEEDTARLAAIVTSAESAIFGMTLDGVITSWNRAAERIFGYTHAEAVGQLNTLIIPADLAAEGSEILERLRRGETVSHYETERLARDGRRIPVSLSVSPITDANGQIIGISKIVRDITARKRTERELVERESRFRLMADHAPVLVWLSDTENRGIYFNRPWIEFTGLPLEQQLGEGWLLLIHPDDRADAGAYCQHHFERRIPFTMEFRLRHHSGEYRWVQDVGQPLFLPDGTFNGYIGSCMDIDARKRLEEAREDAVQRESAARTAAEEASRLKDEFLAVVSHELRTPLNAILGWVQMLRKGPAPETMVRKAVDTIERNARMQVQLVEDLLDVSRIVTGQLALRIEPVDLAAVVEAAVEAVQPSAEAKEITLQLDLLDDDVSVTGDAGRLQQAVWNLLTNALKFTPKEGRIQIELRRTEEDGVVTVRDTGAGIPAEALPYIFDRFRQADSRITRAHGGLGIGLTIVEYVAQAHGGTVRAESPGPGGGATFTLTVPLGASSATMSGGRGISRERPDLSNRVVLVVEDEADVRDLLRTILEGCGAAVMTTGSVAEALAAVRQSPPDLVIGDIGMPEQDGYDLIRAIRALPHLARIPAIALTAYAGQRHRDAAFEAGYDAYLSKPADADTICRTIVDLCAALSVPPLLPPAS